MAPPREELLWTSFMNPNGQGLESTGCPRCHYSNGSATGTQVIAHQPIYLPRPGDEAVQCFNFGFYWKSEKVNLVT